MTEDFESVTPLALWLSYVAAGLMVLALAVAFLIASDAPWWYVAGLALAGGSDFVALRLITALRYQLSPEGIRSKQGPFGSARAWDSLAAVTAGKDRKSWARVFVFRGRGDDDFNARPRDRADFLVAVRRYASHIEVTPEAEALARENGGTA